MRLLFLLGFGLLRFRSLSAQGDAGDLDPGQFAPMAHGPVVPFPAAIFESDDLLVLALLDHFTSDGRALDQGTAMGELVAIAVKEHVAESSFLACISLEEIDIDNIALRDAMLSAACFNNCVSHTKSRVLSGGKAAQTSIGGRL